MIELPAIQVSPFHWLVAVHEVESCLTSPVSLFPSTHEKDIRSLCAPLSQKSLPSVITGGVATNTSFAHGDKSLDMVVLYPD